MNPRIQELVEETVKSVQRNEFGVCDMNKYNQKFAELIIQECATVARNHTLEKSGVSTDYTGIVYVENAIKDHFGVKP